MKLLLLSLFLFVLFTLNLFAQTNDSVKVYDLNEITVKSESLIEPKPTTKIGQNILQKYDGSSLFEIAKYIPSVKPQTNSRGESLFYLRGANERQLGLFFDGTLLNIPWDNRVDLSLIPTTNYKELKIIKGVPSSIYGANNIAGVVVGKSKTITSKELTGQFTSQFSDYGYRKMSLLLNRKIGNFSFLLSGYNFNRNSFSLSNSFSSIENKKNTRINSDQQTSSIYVKAGYEYQKFSNIDISFQYLDSKKGVPPEIGVSSPRFWKYPLWNKIGVNVTGKHNFNFISNSFIDYSFNLYKFEMEIDQYTDYSYSKIEEVEKDNDFVLYGRLIYTILLNKNSIFRFSTSGYSTNHTESFLSNQYQNVEYQQIVYSAGIEYELLQSDFTFIGGISFDGTNAPKTGNFTEKNNLTALGANATLKYNFTNYVNTQINIGHKSRFPSMRESYSDGLGRFVVNTDLRPETVNDIELGFEYLIPDGRLFINLLWTHLYDGIVRSTVSTYNGNKFTRVNKDEIRTYGLELEGNNRFSKYLSGGFSFSYLNSHAKNEKGSFTDTLEYHPEIIANIFIKSEFTKSINLLIETSAIANEFALEEGNAYFQNIPSYILLNTRLSYRYTFSEVSSVELFGRINNLFDKLYYTQFGLPEAGRELFVGIDLKF